MYKDCIWEALLLDSSLFSDFESAGHLEYIPKKTLRTICIGRISIATVTELFSKYLPTMLQQCMVCMNSMFGMDRESCNIEFIRVCMI